MWGQGSFLRAPETVQVERIDIPGGVPACDEVGNQPGCGRRESESKMLVADRVKEILAGRGATDARKIVGQSRTRPHPARPVRVAPITQRAQPCPQARGLAWVRWRVEPCELEVTRSS
jgi:hypothetical protein